MKLTFSSTQWVFFIFANTIVAPLSIGYAFGMSHTQIAELLQRTFFVIGLTTLLQVIFGHKMPILEGPSGLWWGVFLFFAGFSSSSGESADIMLRSLELGVMISGVLFLLISVFKLMDLIRILFSPIVMGTYLILLVSQLSGPFVQGILGIDYLSSGVDATVALCAVTTLVFVMIMARSHNHFLTSYSVLIGLVFGWGLFYLVGIVKPVQVEIDSWFVFPHLLAWGVPIFDFGVVLTSIFTAFILMGNLVTSINVVADVLGEKKKDIYNRSGLVMGVNQLISGLFSTIGGVPVPGSAGFILTTRIKERLPLLIASMIVLVISFLPILMTFFASIPMPVGYATIFLAIAGLVGLALRQYKTVLMDEKSIFIIGFSLMAGLGTMFVPEKVWLGLPNSLTSILNNGLVVGVVICIILESIMRSGLILKKVNE